MFRFFSWVLAGICTGIDNPVFQKAEIICSQFLVSPGSGVFRFDSFLFLFFCIMYYVLDNHVFGFFLGGNRYFVIGYVVYMFHSC